MKDDSNYTMLYYTLVDISVPSGPAVNEITFLNDLSNHHSGKIVAVIPKPAGDETLFPRNIDYLYLSNGFKNKSLLQFIALRLIGFIKLRKELEKAGRKFIVSRVSILDFPLVVNLRILKCIPFFIRHAPDGSFKAFGNKNLLRKIFSIVAKAVFKRIASYADCIDFMNERHLLNFSENFPLNNSRKLVVNNGVDHRFFDYSINTNILLNDRIRDAELVLAYCGSYPEKRGAYEVVLTLIDALRDGVDAVALIVGDDSSLNNCRVLINQYRLSDKCFILGRVDYKDIPGIMYYVDIGFSILRKNERNESEQKVRQYLASNCRVVVTQGSNDFLNNEEFAVVVDDIMVSYWELIKKKFVKGYSKETASSRTYSLENLSYTQQNRIRFDAWSEVLLESKYY